jgi:hypothetical protein
MAVWRERPFGSIRATSRRDSCQATIRAALEIADYCASNARFDCVPFCWVRNNFGLKEGWAESGCVGDFAAKAAADTAF